MAANTNIGKVDKYILQTTDALGESMETNISKGIAVNPSATYSQVDTASRAIAALSQNSYHDTILVTNISVNEVMAE